MGLPVTVYRWDDAGAPQLTAAKPSEIINVLKKCLVEGYGTKSALGWSVLFEDTGLRKIVLRNSPVTGSGGAFQLWSDGGADLFSTPMRVKSAISISALDTFFKPSYQQAMSARTSSWNEWVLIGTSNAFYFIYGLTGGNTDAFGGIPQDNTIFVGDYDEFIPGDLNRFIAVINTNQTGNVTGSSFTLNDRFYYAFNTTSVAGCINLYGTQGEDTAVNYGVNSIFTMTNLASGIVFGNTKIGIYFPVLISLTLNPKSTLPNTLDLAGTPSINSTVYPLFRGKFPGLIMAISSNHRAVDWPVIDLHNGAQHMLMRSVGTQQCVWINMEEW